MKRKSLGLLCSILVVLLVLGSACSTLQPVEQIAPVSVPAPQSLSEPQQVQEPQAPQEVPEPQDVPIPAPAPASEEVTVDKEAIDWKTDATQWRYDIGKRFTLVLPTNGSEGAIWGTGVYTDDSSIGTAAVHMGLITLANGGTVTIEMRPGQDSYQAMQLHGITSASYGQWEGSYVFVDEKGLEITIDLPLGQVQLLTLDEEVPAFGDYLQITNLSGYDIASIAISLDNKCDQPQPDENLLDNEILPNNGMLRVYLDDLPELKANLYPGASTILHVRALDTDNDSYCKTWPMDANSWNIEITIEDLYLPDYLVPTVKDSLREEPEYLGDYFLITNETGYDINYIDIYTYSMLLENEFGENLLDSNLLSNGESVRIYPNYNPDIEKAVYEDVDANIQIEAIDVDGDMYLKQWYPDHDSWNVAIQLADMVGYEVEEVESYGDYFQVTNNIGFEIWYLFIATEDMVDALYVEDDLLGDDILMDRSSIEVYHKDIPWLDEFIGSRSDELLYLVAFDEDDDMYVLEWFPNFDPWHLVVTMDDIVY